MNNVNKNDYWRRIEMAHFMLRPDMKTSGGEVCDISLDGRYVGTIALIIREGHRVAGSVQLEQDSLTRAEKQEAIAFIQNYVDQTVAAVGAHDCEVVVTCSTYEVIIASEEQIGVIKEFGEPGEEGTNVFEEAEDDDEYGYGEDEEVTYSLSGGMSQTKMLPQSLRDPSYYELVIVGESRNRVEYHVYDRDDEWIAEAFLRIRGADVVGEINWVYEPLENEIEFVVDLLVADLDESEVDTIQLDMLYQGQIMETMKLSHEDLLDEDDRSFTDYEDGAAYTTDGEYI
ncbi:MAG: hypothetical protein K0R67_832 [Paenibacillus sp.]|nr:hypothetical protein [Paenibacillus sp.]